MEKQPQPVFSQNRRKLSENEREKMYKESPRPQNGGGNYLVVNILRNFSHLFFFSPYTEYPMAKIQFFLDEAMKIHRSFIASSTPILLNSSFRHTNI